MIKKTLFTLLMASLMFSVQISFIGYELSDEVDFEAGDFGLGMPIGDTGAQVGVLYVMSLTEPMEDAGFTWNGLFFNAGYSF